MTGISDIDDPRTDARNPRGLTQAEAVQRRERVGPNSVAEPGSRPLRAFMRKLNGPVPWMLEAALALEIVQGKAVEVLVLGGQANVYLVRERGHLWSSRPGGWLLLASTLDLLVVTTLVTSGWLMAPVGLKTVGSLAVAVAAFVLLLDEVKVRMLYR